MIHHSAPWKASPVPCWVSTGGSGCHAQHGTLFAGHERAQVRLWSSASRGRFAAWGAGPATLSLCPFCKQKHGCNTLGFRHWYILRNVYKGPFSKIKKQKR